VFIGSQSVTTNQNGNAPISFTPANDVPAGQTVTATATRAGNTSEFSGAQAVTTP
jgi:hypothetical protein